MRAGESFSSPTSGPVNSASVALSLLALTKLDNVDLAVALLVDFWLPGVEEMISDEAAILVVDAALRSGKAKRTARCSRSAVPEFRAPRPLPVDALAELYRRLLESPVRPEDQAVADRCTHPHGYN